MPEDDKTIYFPEGGNRKPDSIAEMMKLVDAGYTTLAAAKEIKESNVILCQTTLHIPDRYAQQGFAHATLDLKDIRYTKDITEIPEIVLELEERISPFVVSASSEKYGATTSKSGVGIGIALSNNQVLCSIFEPPDCIRLCLVEIDTQNRANEVSGFSLSGDSINKDNYQTRFNRLLKGLV